MTYLKRETGNDDSGTPLVTAVSQIANFSKKQLWKEDLANIYKDFETLIWVRDINDLELADFNSWDINLEGNSF